MCPVTAGPETCVALGNDAVVVGLSEVPPVVFCMLAWNASTEKFIALLAKKVSVPNCTVPTYVSAGTRLAYTRKPKSGATSRLKDVRLVSASHE